MQVAGHEGVFSYLPNLYLSDKWAERAGIFWYGYAKRMGKLAMGNDSYSVATPAGAPIWSGRYQQKDIARPLTASPDCGLMQSILERPLVSEGKFSRWQFSSFDFGLTSAYVAGVAAEITVSDAYLANIPAGRMTAKPLAIGPQHPNPTDKLPGAFRIWSSWTLSYPLDSSRIAGLEVKRTKLPQANKG